MTSPQVDKTHYDFSRYAFPGRFVSYYQQLKEVLALTPASVLEVGIGDKVFGSFIKNNTSVAYTSVDVQPDLQPDRVGTILELPFADKSFDVACAFEVLEHLPFEQFDRAVAELCRVARTHVVISVPHFGPTLSFSLKIPLVPRIELAFKIPFPKEHVFNGEHYWEIGKRGYPARRIREKLSVYGQLARDFVPFESQYHHFFVLTLKNV